MVSLASKKNPHGDKWMHSDVAMKLENYPKNINILRIEEYYPIRYVEFTNILGEVGYLNKNWLTIHLSLKPP